MSWYVTISASTIDIKSAAKVRISGFDATVYVSSSSGTKNSGSKAFDNDLHTIWHSCWHGSYNGRRCNKSDNNTMLVAFEKKQTFKAVLLYKRDDRERYNKVCVIVKVKYSGFKGRLKMFQEPYL